MTLPTLQAPPRAKPQLALADPDPATDFMDSGYSAHQLLQSLANTLAGAARFRDACRELQEQAARRERREGEPVLFSFDKNWQSRLDVLRPKRDSYLTSHGMTASRRAPRDAQAWDEFDALLAEALPTLTASVEARRIARALPGLTAAAAALAADHAGAGRLRDLLNVADDMAFSIRHPASRREWRIVASGLEDNFQLQVLLADVLPLGGAGRYDSRLVAAYRGLPVTDEVLTGRLRFGMYAHTALRADGGLPRGMSGSDHWIWGERSPRTIPVIHGERVVYLGEPPYPMEWEVERRFPALRGAIEVMEAEIMLPLAA